MLFAVVLSAAWALPGHASVIISPLYSTPSQTTLVTADTHLPNDHRVFTLSKQGVVTVHDTVANTTSTFLDLTSQVKSTLSDERGLLGMTFDPNYATNGRYYLFMTVQPVAGGAYYSQVERFTDTSVAGVSAEAPKPIIQFDAKGSTNHQAGWIDFGKDGNLLIAVGDGGNGSAPDMRHTGQDPSDFMGSILRINPNGDSFPADPNNNYSIPAGNLNVAGAAPEVYAYGLRNPFRDSVAPDGNVIIGDVGQDQREEIDILNPNSANRNFGWSLREGDIATPLVGGPVPADYVAPSFVYDHTNPGGQAIIGGYVYRGTAVPELDGRYVFGDEVTGDIWSIAYTGSGFLANTVMKIGNIPSLDSFGETNSGELLVSQFVVGGGSQVYALTSDTPRAVPEPGTWAMMVAGLGLIGGALRRRRRAALRLGDRHGRCSGLSRQHG